MKALIAIALIWAPLSGGAGSAKDANASSFPIPHMAAVQAVSQGMRSMLSRSRDYTSSWDGQRISTQAMSQVW